MTQKTKRKAIGTVGKANLWGVHAVKEAAQNKKRTLHRLYVTENALHRNQDWVSALPSTIIETVDRKTIDKMVGQDAVHQGIALHCAPLEEEYLEDILNRDKDGLIVILDQVTDPHNIGAIMRSACAFGAQAIVVQKKHAPDPIGVLAKTASGAVEHVPYIREINLSRAIEALQGRGYSVIGLDERGTAIAPQNGKMALVLGAEGRGLRPKVADHCDILAALPTGGPIPTLNVSNAAAVAFYALSGGGA